MQPESQAYHGARAALYRDGTELRSVWYSKPDVARRACFFLGDQCDYPILMGM